MSCLFCCCCFLGRGVKLKKDTASLKWRGTFSFCWFQHPLWTKKKTKVMPGWRMVHHEVVCFHLTVKISNGNMKMVKQSKLYLFPLMRLSNCDMSVHSLNRDGQTRLVCNCSLFDKLSTFPSCHVFIVKSQPRDMSLQQKSSKLKIQFWTELCVED